MTILNWASLIFSWLFFLAGFFIIFSCFVGLFRFKDFFIRIHAIKISSIYGISFVLLGAGFSTYEIVSFLQILLAIILNILTTILVVHSVCRIALGNNIQHAGISRRKYNEMMAEKEKKEAEERIKERIRKQREKIKEELGNKDK